MTIADAQVHIWGADTPDRPRSYREAITMFTEERSFLSASDKEWSWERVSANGWGGRYDPGRLAVGQAARGVGQRDAGGLGSTRRARHRSDG